MNRLFSYQWLKEYVDTDDPPEKIAERISLSGPAVERIVPAAELLDHVVVGRVASVAPHPNADRLRVASVRIGAKKTATIVCGGSNLAEGQWVAVALPGSRVRWHGQGEPVTLKLTEIRGVESGGMIAAANEIGLADAFPHGERDILDLGKAFDPNELEEGVPLADVLGLADDVLFDIEVTTNRVDAMGTVGMAREIAAITGRPFLWKPAPTAKRETHNAKRTNQHPGLDVRVHDPDLCPRYMAVRMEGVAVGPSPWWIRRKLMSAGMDSINNVVDITNLILLELSQPLHAFDAAKISGGIRVRRARNGETMLALDGETYTLDDTMLVIADEKDVAAVAGIKGGEISGIGTDTTDIILEAATFDPISIRRTSRTLGLQSDAQARFEKGLSTESADVGLTRAVQLVKNICGGRVASAVTDVRATPYVPKSFTIPFGEIVSLMGVELPQNDMTGILRRLGFGIKTPGGRITATVPWWRDHDIEDGRDLVEEIARVYGYANIPPVVPVGEPPRPVADELLWEDRIRTVLQGDGMMETYSYSFVSDGVMRKCGFDPDMMLRVQNELTSDYTVMRTTLLPSLLSAAAENRERAADLRLFEIANVYLPPKGLRKTKRGLLWTDLPDEQLELGMVFAGVADAWRHAKGVLEHVIERMGIRNVRWERLSDGGFWHPGRSVQAFAGNRVLATAGEVHPSIARGFKLDRPSCVHLPVAKIVDLATTTPTFTPVPSFPPVLRDLAIQVHARVEYDDVDRAIRAADPLVAEVAWFDTYMGKGLPADAKSVAMHLTFSAPDRTLTGADVDAAMGKIALMLKEKFKAKVR